MSEYKALKLVDPDLISGSGDWLRTQIGSNWELLSSSVMGEYYDWTEPDVAAIEVDDAGYYTYKLDEHMISQVYSNPLLKVTTSADAYVPNFNMPIRLIGNPDLIQSDEMWQTYLFGGTYKDMEFVPLYSTAVWKDTYYTRNNPYTTLEEKQIQKLQSTFDGIDINLTTQYNYYLKDYQSFIDTLLPNQIPNMYMFAPDVVQHIGDEVLSDIPVALLRYLTIDKNVETEDIEDIMNSIETSALLPRESYSVYMNDYATVTSDTFEDLNYNLRNYLTASLSVTSMSSSTMVEVNSQLQNIIFGQVSANKLLGPTADYVARYCDYFPYYISINIPNELKTNAGFTEVITNSNYDNALLLSLKESPIVSSFGYVLGVTYTSASSDGENVAEYESTTPAAYPQTNLIERMVNGLQDSTTDYMKDSIFLDELDSNTKAFYNVETPYRFAIARNLRNALNGIIGTGPVSAYTDAGGSILNPGQDIESDDYWDFTGIWALFTQGGHEKYSETIAYRIEKKYANNVIQNVWIYNDNTQESFTYYDTQVQYDTAYEYTVYAYDVVVGLKYKYDDWIYTTQIGLSSADTYCLQFQSAATGEPADMIFNNESISMEWQAILPTPYNMVWGAWSHSGWAGSAYAEKYDEDPSRDFDADPAYDEDGDRSPSMAEYKAWAVETKEYYWTTWYSSQVAELVETDLAEAGFATAAQVDTEHQYMTEFNLYYEPMVSIVEVPLTTKTLRVLDNPPPPVEIEPYQMLDDSQRIGFKVMVETFDKEKLRTPLSAEDAEYDTAYQSAKNMLSGDFLAEANRSRTSKIEVYRMVQEPSSYAEFAQHLHKTYVLNQTSINSYDTMTHCIDIINTNTKYYYMFRAVSELEVAGKMSEIYESELINDGGYKYAVFNTISETDLKIVENIPVSVPFKKLFYLKPSLNNLNLGGVLDYDEDAHTQMENVVVGDADYPIWDRKFKFRLTSKKTGKKIDFNITYKVREG